MNKMLRRQASMTACALLLSAAGATAQTADDADPRTEAQGHVGVFYFTPHFAVKELGVDTNVFNTADQKSDFTATLTPKIDVWVPMARRARLSTSVAADAVYYQTYSTERSLNPEVKLRGDLFLGRLSPFAEASYLRTRQRLNFEIDARSQRDERASAIGVAARVSPKLSVEGGVRQSTVDFSADAVFNHVFLRESLNHDGRTVFVTARHSATPLTTLVLKAEQGRDRFEFAAVRDSDTVRVMPGVEFKANALISGAAYVGFRRFTPLNATLESFKGGVANAGLTYTLKGSTRFVVTADRDLTYSYEPTQPYFVVGGIGVAVRRQIVGRVDASVSVQRQQYAYRSLLVPGAADGDLRRVDVTRTWSANLGYRLGRGPRVGFGTLYRQRESNSSRFVNYDGLRIASTIDYDF